jgi:hypothetical protein
VPELLQHALGAFGQVHWNPPLVFGIFLSLYPSVAVFASFNAVFVHIRQCSGKTIAGRKNLSSCKDTFMSEGGEKR